MSLTFIHQTLGQRVLFGAGRAREHLESEAQRHAPEGRGVRVMAIVSGSASEAATSMLAGVHVVSRHDGAAQHVPSEVVEAARAEAAEAGGELLVCIGGGSAVGLAKAVALTAESPIIAVPTTYAGSEGTNVWGITQDGTKMTGVDDRVLPASVIYDADLVRDFPRAESVASGLNAVAHCVDSLWASGADPINRVGALEALRALSQGLPMIVEDPAASLEGRELCQYGAYLSAVAFASAGSGFHHKICHALGGAFDLPHAQTHAVVLPYVLAFNAAAVPSVSARIAEALGAQGLGAQDAVEGLMRLGESVGAPRALRDHGLAESQLEQAAELVAQCAPPSNPRPVGIEEARELVTAAWAGSDPRALGL